MRSGMQQGYLERLLDLEEIRNLRIKYSHLLDGNRIEALGELFAEDAICDAGRGAWRGRAAIRDGLAEAIAAYDHDQHGSYPFMHAVTNQWVEITGEDTAEGRCYLLDLQTLGQAKDDRWILLGMYADEYRRIEGRWYISRTRLDVSWPSRDIGGGLPGEGLVLPLRRPSDDGRAHRYE